MTLTPITNEEFNNAAPLISRGGTVKDFISLDFAMLFIVANKVYLKDSISMGSFTFDTHEFCETFKAIDLLKDVLYLREGFVDKSMNTDIYSPLKKFALSIGDLNTNYEGLKKIYDKINEI